jgi:hypothetical protein
MKETVFAEPLDHTNTSSMHLQMYSTSRDTNPVPRIQPSLPLPPLLLVALLLPCVAPSCFPSKLTKPYHTRSSSPSTLHPLHPPLHAERPRGRRLCPLAADAAVTHTSPSPRPPLPLFLISPVPVRLLALADSPDTTLRVCHGAASRGQAPQEGGGGEEGRNGGSGGGARRARRRLVGRLLHADVRCVTFWSPWPYVSTRFVRILCDSREHIPVLLL